MHRKRPSAHRVAFLSLASLAAAWLAVTPAAHAQSNTALAERLFLDGEKLMDAGQYLAACAKFTDSQRLDPALGTLMHLAACHEKSGRFATAWSEFTDAAAQAQRANQGDREKFARDHAAALDGKLQKVIIELSHPPDGTLIKLDGAALPAGVLGTEIPLDPGDHSLEVTAPRKKPWRQAKLNLGPSAVVTRVQVTLEDDAPAVPDSTAPVPPAGGGSPGGAPVPDQATGSGSATKVVGYSVGAAGVVSLGVAVAEEITSVGRNSDESKYPSGSPQRQTVADQSSTAQTYAIVFGAAGLAAVGVGLYLVLTSHDASPAAPRSGALTVTPLVGGGVAGAGLHIDW